MSYGKITKQELSEDLIKLIESSSSSSGAGVEFIAKGKVVNRNPGVFYLVEKDSKEIGDGDFGGIGVETNPSI